MKLEGLHHITMITGDARPPSTSTQACSGLRLVKKTVNFDQPDAYHLYFGDERGAPGSILTWFEFPGAARGRAGIGDIHVLQLGVAPRPRWSSGRSDCAAGHATSAAMARCASRTPMA